MLAIWNMQEKNVVFNLSSKHLSESLLRSLQLGLSFVPRPYYCPFDTRIDIYKLLRLIKLKKFLGKREPHDQQIENETSKFKPRPTFIPSVTDPSIATFEGVILEQIEKVETCQYRINGNLNTTELENIRQLASDPSLILKPAGKGGGYCHYGLRL